ncbi:MAG: hypothetical protein MUE44_09040 [Oscillatoriaceae cyanobacterium Prado104]|jgi:hypothetical protein|nr:hypothetical protein [Oscillatoriaceae cyanobacterium Prado104]
MQTKISDLLGTLGNQLDNQLNNALKAPKLELFYQGILAALKSSWTEKIWQHGTPLYTKSIVKVYERFGLPDFQAPVSLGNNGFVLRQFGEGTGTYIPIPNCLQIRSNQDGQVDFKLQLIRSSQTGFPPESHGCLDFRVEPRFHMEEALEKIRAIQPGARLVTPNFVWGYLHIQLQGAEGLPEKIEPMFLCWNGLSTGRITTQLSQQTATFLKSALVQGGTLMLKTVAEVLAIGVSPRVPANVRLNPINLLKKLRTELTSRNGLIARQSIVNFFSRTKTEEMGLEKVECNGTYSQQDFAEAMADRVLIYFGNLAPSPSWDSGFYVKLEDPEHLEKAQSTLDNIRVEWSKFWMLGVPVTTGRMYWLPLDMVEASQQLERAMKLGQQIVQEDTVPALLDGKVRVQVAVNIPSPRQGVDALGVKILNSPDLDRYVLLPETGDPEHIDLKFPPKTGNSYEYNYTTHVRLNGQNQDLQSKSKPHIVTNFDNDFLYLDPNDFPVGFIPVEASKELLNQGVVQGTLKWSGGEVPFNLSSKQQTISLAMPKDAENATLNFEVHSVVDVGYSALKILLPAKGTMLTPYNFREFGLQNVEINCTPSQNNPVIYEFQREGDDNDSNNQTLWFTSDTTKRTLIYNSYSLFQYRFRYRRQGQSQWSDYIAPFQSLQLNP